MLVDPVCDILYGDPCYIPLTQLAIPISITDISFSSTFVLHPPTDSILASVSTPFDPSVGLMCQMSVLIEQQDRIMVEITQLRANTEHHTVEFATLRGMIAYLHLRIRQMCKHWDYEGNDYHSNEAADRDDAAADHLLGIPSSFIKKGGTSNSLIFLF